MFLKDVINTIRKSWNDLGIRVECDPISDVDKNLTVHSNMGDLKFKLNSSDGIRCDGIQFDVDHKGASVVMQRLEEMGKDQMLRPTIVVTAVGTKNLFGGVSIGVVFGYPSEYQGEVISVPNIDNALAIVKQHLHMKRTDSLDEVMLPANKRDDDMVGTFSLLSNKKYSGIGWRILSSLSYNTHRSSEKNEEQYIRHALEDVIERVTNDAIAYDEISEDREIAVYVFGVSGQSTTTFVPSDGYMISDDNWHEMNPSDLPSHLTSMFYLSGAVATAGYLLQLQHLSDDLNVAIPMNDEFISIAGLPNANAFEFDAYKEQVTLYESHIKDMDNDVTKEKYVKMEVPFE